MSDKKSSVERLADFLGPNTEAKDALQAAVDEVRKERADKQKAKAKELIIKAITLQEQQEEADKKYKNAKKKFDKELGNIMATLERMSNGEAPKENQENEEQASN